MWLGRGGNYIFVKDIQAIKTFNCTPLFGLMNTIAPPAIGCGVGGMDFVQ